MRYFIGLLLLITIGCEAKEEVKLTKIKMSDDSFVTNCQDYNSARSKLSLLESNRNMSIASEYLKCSLLLAVGEIEGKRELLEDIYSTMKVTDFPLSLANNVNGDVTFKNMGWHIDYKKNKIYYEKNDINIALFLEKKLNGGYLVFVIDEVLKGTYRAYFPVKLVKVNTGYTVKPVYESGF